MLSRVRKGGVEGGIPAGVAITERLGSGVHQPEER